MRWSRRFGFFREQFIVLSRKMRSQPTYKRNFLTHPLNPHSLYGGLDGGSSPHGRKTRSFFCSQKGDQYFQGVPLTTTCKPKLQLIRPEINPQDFNLFDTGRYTNPSYACLDLTMLNRDKNLFKVGGCFCNGHKYEKKFKDSCFALLGESRNEPVTQFPQYQYFKRTSANGRTERYVVISNDTYNRGNYRLCALVKLFHSGWVVIGITSLDKRKLIHVEEGNLRRNDISKIMDLATKKMMSLIQNH